MICVLLSGLQTFCKPVLVMLESHLKDDRALDIVEKTLAQKYPWLLWSFYMWAAASNGLWLVIRGISRRLAWTAKRETMKGDQEAGIQSPTATETEQSLTGAGGRGGGVVLFCQIARWWVKDLLNLCGDYCFINQMLFLCHCHVQIILKPLLWIMVEYPLMRNT